MAARKTTLDDENARRLIEARHHEPFAVLGRHGSGKAAAIRVFMPRARQVFVESKQNQALRVGDTDLFEFRGNLRDIPEHYKLVIEADDGSWHERVDPYTFKATIDDSQLRRFNDGTHRRAQDILGSSVCEIDGVRGTRFSVWAPNAERVSVVGDFNQWDGRIHPMRVRGESGVWELFIPGLDTGRYKFELRNRDNGNLLLRTDPYARATELRPATAAVIATDSQYQWQDRDWLSRRGGHDWQARPLSVYEVHIASWRRAADGTFLNYRTVAPQLAEHVKRLGFTHVELLPVTEHPLDESWGYQTTGYFSPTSRFGTPDDFRYFVDLLHQQGIGVILDWVPAHFPRDEFALANFDGKSLYEYHESSRAEHRDWGTLVFNYERDEVRSFLISSALFWLREFHLDGLRVDAVASMLYLDFSRQAENWAPNRYGGNQNLEAIDFICELNNAVREETPDCLMIAEESTDWPGVTESTSAGGLGFHMKWNMGWMHDTLNYFGKETIHRKYHQDWLTFSPTYAFEENFMLPFSHDEVVHLKRSLLGRMPGDEWQRFANLRALYVYQWCFPGKKLLFMGGELAQPTEWAAGGEIPWERLQREDVAGVNRLLSALNRLHHDTPALTEWDFDRRGFEWIDGDDRERSVILFMRHAPGQSVVVAMNFTPVVRHQYRIGVPCAGRFREILNSDDGRFGGSGVGNGNNIESQPVPWQGRAHSIEVTLPPLAGLVLLPGQAVSNTRDAK
ncbi:MAG: 1,4-alpha-glucan branching protein GlgB [Gammaproteobacteria bacterium]|nr:1,4-alpha-glucan branching protein GlgB [Gammaproteobacteria bacterium]MDH4314355.1 1,4-alpha-glucan branching protein GlgB [Gammaproteobacteria bacterium]MDH5214193.1 1,4-alpha-glucan branching protein GlgB [Gammaproteobacteria bacterium]